MRFWLRILICLVLATQPLAAWDEAELREEPLFVNPNGEIEELPGLEQLHNAQPFNYVPDTDMRLQAPFAYRTRPDLDLDLPRLAPEKPPRPPENPPEPLRPEAETIDGGTGAAFDRKSLHPAEPVYQAWSRQLAALRLRAPRHGLSHRDRNIQDATTGRPASVPEPAPSIP